MSSGRRGRSCPGRALTRAISRTTPRTSGMWWSARRVRAGRAPGLERELQRVRDLEVGVREPASRAIARAFATMAGVRSTPTNARTARGKGLGEEARAAADVEGALVAARRDGRDEAGDGLGSLTCAGGDEAVHLRRELNDDVFGCIMRCERRESNRTGCPTGS